MTQADELTSPHQLRELISTGEWVGPTAGILDGYQQANLAIVPRSIAFDFLLYCTRNPKPCPLLAVSDPGNPIIHIGHTVVDVRHALPRYRVWRYGELVAEPTELADFWRPDSVAFLLGCSHTFEGPLRRAGVPVRYSDHSPAPAVYITDRATSPAGDIDGPLVVSLRFVPGELAAKAVEITARYPTGHGAPVHIGDPTALGIDDTTRPDFGPEPVSLPGDIPMFWACGVTPQVALPNSGAEYVITHSPGHMLVLDHQVDNQPE